MPDSGSLVVTMMRTGRLVHVPSDSGSLVFEPPYWQPRPARSLDDVVGHLREHQRFSPRYAEREELQCTACPWTTTQLDPVAAPRDVLDHLIEHAETTPIPSGTSCQCSHLIIHLDGRPASAWGCRKATVWAAYSAFSDWWAGPVCAKCAELAGPSVWKRRHRLLWTSDTQQVIGHQHA
jgi:hypothetical protein